MRREDLRNIAIIAHVDHGKTTLVDVMLRQAGIFRENERVVERVMDSNELERERGITILAKNTSVMYRGVTINIVDTPGHADFSGEVERILTMVDGALLVVDAAEGPMPQTRYVLRKALEVNLKPIVVLNKIDRADARAKEVVDEVLELFMDLDANEEQLDFPLLYASARDGLATADLGVPGSDLQPLFETILASIPAPQGDPDGILQMLCTTLDYDDYQGRLAIGRIAQGTVVAGQAAAVCRRDGTLTRGKINKVYITKGLERLAVDSATIGDIVAVTGFADINIGETLSAAENPAALPVLHVDEPTLVMTFRVNDSPFAGQEGQFVTSRHLRERLMRELERNVSLKVEETDSPDSFRVLGRGELHLSILIETMRREGYELAVSKPEVLFKEEDGVLMEPLELLLVDVPEEYVGVVMEEIGRRRGELLNMAPGGAGGMRLEFEIPARGLIGVRSELLTATHGYGTMNHLFSGYGHFRGEVPARTHGSLVAAEDGVATPYALHALEDRGIFFIGPGTKVYKGMVTGEHTRDNDIEVNVCKKKHVTNVRSSTSDEGIRLTPPHILSLEEAIEFIAPDELLEVTPQNLRVRKDILDPGARVRRAKERQSATKRM